MLIIPEYGACFVCVPKTGTQALSQYLEKHLRTNESRRFLVESLHDYHANLEEVDATKELPFSVYDMYTFAVVRNPFERVVSYCASTDPGFAENPHNSVRSALIDYLETGKNRWMMPQSHFTAGVKQLFRYEDYDSTLKALRFKFNITNTEPMPVVNDSVHERYPIYFDNDAKALAEYVYREDLRAFGYRF